ncbi:MAG: cupin domain-containing protein [Chloroflexi bacterium]|nr:cupin domain-containing protein [Chloroflexota bacterium]
MTTHRRPSVVGAEDLPLSPVPGTNATFRVPIDRTTTGCQNLVQRVFRYEAGTSPEMINEDSEDVIFVVSGSGEAVVGRQTYPLTLYTGLLAPPRVPYVIRIPGPAPLELVSVLSPQPGRPASVPPSPKAKPVGKLAVHESEEKSLPAGDDRYFKLMIDPRYGSKYLTQFIGFIDKSRAPFHIHPYEEAIYILGGAGIVHIESGDYPIRAGTSIYLPPGTSHCLENAGPETLRLLGVFCPAGSPADKEEDE